MSSEKVSQAALESGPSQEELSFAGSGRTAGEVIGGKYKLIQRLGSGGMGSVYKAEHSMLGRFVALKILHSSLCESEEYLERFRREALVASKLNHPHAITLFDFGIEGRSPYLVMQYVEGCTLKDTLMQDGNLKLDRIANILVQVGGALAEAHALGIVHRDLKPDNIMLSHKADGRETAYMLDFGIAKPLNPLTGSDHTGNTNLTRAGVFMGTPQYMSPEQALDKQCDARSDIYSLGIILYEMISGDVPFKSTSPVELLFKHVNNVPAPIREFAPKVAVPQAISDVVARALAKDPADRFQRVEDLVEAFHRALMPPPDPVLVPSNPRRPLPAVRLAGSIFTACAVAGLAYYMLRGEENEDIDPSTAIEEQLAEQQAVPLMVAEPAVLETVQEQLTPSTEPILTSDTQPQSVAIAQPSVAPAVVTAPVTPEVAPVVEAALSADPSAQPVVTVAPEAVTDLLASMTATPTEQNPPAPQNASDITEEASAIAAAVVSTIQLALTGTAPAEDIAPAEDPASLGEGGPLDEFSVAHIDALTPDKPERDGKSASDKLYEEGQRLFLAGSYQDAALKFRDALLQRRRNLSARLSLGLTMLRLNQPELARQHFAEAQRISPDYPPTLYNFATYYAYMGESSEAVVFLKKALALYPKMKGWLDDDPDFDRIRHTEEFQALVRKD